MAVTLRDMPADWESPETEELDPFRYGWRPKYVRLAGGGFEERQIPLTVEDLLDPQLGDVVTQSDPHFGLMVILAELLRRHYADRADVLVAGDLKMLVGSRWNGGTSQKGRYAPGNGRSAGPPDWTACPQHAKIMRWQTSR